MHGADMAEPCLLVPAVKIKLRKLRGCVGLESARGGGQSRTALMLANETVVQPDVNHVLSRVGNSLQLSSSSCCSGHHLELGYGLLHPQLV
jgi:hypothetical protein